MVKKMPFGEYKDFADCVAKNSDKEDPKAYCAAIKRQIEGDVRRKIAFDTATLDDKILVDDDDYLVMPAVIASEIVHQYEDGWAYKPADEIERMAKIASDIGTIPVKILEHPGPSTNYLLVKQHDVFGRAENFHFVKNLKDSKTGRPMRRGVRADIRWFKNRVPEKVLTQIRNGSLRDVSIGFTFDHDYTRGKWNGDNYDYIQRNLFLNHLAAPIKKGRCPGPVCGIGFDASSKYGLDATTLKNCPVCRHIIDVGLEDAGKRLFTKYGGEVLRVINGTYKPPPKRKTVADLDKEFRAAFEELESRLPKT